MPGRVDIDTTVSKWHATRMLRIALILFVALPAFAAGPNSHDIDVDDYFSLAAVLSTSISPNGRYVAYVDLRWNTDTKTRNGDLWVVDTKTKATRRLTFHKDFDAHVQWSPDSAFLYFDSRRDQGKQVYRIRPDGTDLRQITRKKGGITSFRLSADGDTVYFARTHKITKEPWAALKRKHSKVTYGHGVVKASELHALDLTTWRSRRPVEPKRVLVAWDVSADERRIAMVTRPTEELITNEGWSTVDILEVGAKRLWSLPDAQWREQAPSPYGWLDAVSWSADGNALAFTIDFDGFPAELFVARFEGEKTAIAKVARPDSLTVNSGARPLWRGASKDLLFVGERDARVRVYEAPKAGTDKPQPAYQVTTGDIVVGGLSVTKDGRRIAYTVADPTNFGDVYVSKVAKKAKARTRLTTVNPQTSTWKLPTLQEVTWKSTDGVQVQGILALPAGYQKGTKLPMIVYIHGGPASSTKLRLRFWGYGRTLMAAKGYAVFSPNYRGSTGFGDEFLVELIGRKNDIDVKDILSGVDAMVKQGIADPERLGVMGWSNGGYLTNCIITHTDRFAAASSGAGVFDVAMQWAIEDTPGHVVNYQKGLPWQRAESMQKASPMYDVHKVKTPTLVHVGEHDARVPAEHSRALHRALHHYLKVPTELIVYPGEGHGLSKYDHRRAKMQWDLAWFSKYLLGNATN